MASYNSFKRIDRQAIVDGQVQGSDIAPGAVGSNELANDAVTSNKIANQAVTSDKLDATLDLSTKNITYRPFVNNDFSGSANISESKMATGAAEVNLGYTPLSTAGNNAMSGRLAVVDGSASSPSIRGNDTNTGIYFADNQVRFSINGNDALQIDSAGRAAFPSKPMFAAAGQPGWLYANSYGGTGARELN